MHPPQPPDASQEPEGGEDDKDLDLASPSTTSKGKRRQQPPPSPPPVSSPSSIPFPYSPLSGKACKKAPSKPTCSREVRNLHWEWSEEPEPQQPQPAPPAPACPRRSLQPPREWWTVERKAQAVAQCCASPLHLYRVCYVQFEEEDSSSDDDSPAPSGGARNCDSQPSNDEGYYVPSDKSAALVRALEIVYPAEELLTFEQAAERAYSMCHERACKVAADNTEPWSFREAMLHPDKDRMGLGSWSSFLLAERPLVPDGLQGMNRDAHGQIERYKGCLVAQGFSQHPGIDFHEVFAPTMRWAALRTILALAAIEDMEVESIDISNAYLNGVLPENEVVYMRQPEGFQSKDDDWVCRLRKGLYGLKQSGHFWYQKLGEVLEGLGFKRLVSDPSIYVWGKEGIKGTKDIKLTYSLDPSQSSLFTTFVNCSFKGKVEAPAGQEGAASMVTYTDSDFAGDKSSGKSTNGYLVKVGTGAVSWASKLQGVIVKSSTEAEFYGASFAGSEIKWLCNFLQELGYSFPSPCPLLVNNQSTIQVLNDAVHHSRMKHIPVAEFWIRDEVTKVKSISIQYCPTEEMPADLLTKSLARQLVVTH
ncbi:hypothetical protein FRC05_009366 [Tulasnella sp. 425]|nr:hypothetical protein FRC05_009366 [Tulasnella sp. 425]